jgi:hypothetical protein
MLLKLLHAGLYVIPIVNHYEQLALATDRWSSQTLYPDQSTTVSKRDFSCIARKQLMDVCIYGLFLYNERYQHLKMKTKQNKKSPKLGNS